jgi:hypothetical protein
VLRDLSVAQRMFTLCMVTVLRVVPASRGVSVAQSAKDVK